MKSKWISLMGILIMILLIVRIYVDFGIKIKKIFENTQSEYAKLLRRLERMEIEELWGRKSDFSELRNLSAYSAISIYGIGKLGEKLYKELKDQNIAVKFFIDKNIGYSNSNIPIFKPNEEIPYTDLMIVTPIYDFWDIRYQYINKDIKVISITDILNGSI